jgi:hypothetical protein
MPSKRFCLVFFAIGFSSCVSLVAQEKSARDQLVLARGQYYTPTASGLKSFRCEASIDWKAMMTRFSGNEITDDNPSLKYLRSTHLAISDDLKGRGSLEWNSSIDLPAGKEASITQLRDGLQTAVVGFFQSWNAYMNGSMVPFPDQTVTVTQSSDGFHLSGASKDLQFNEDFDKNMLLRQVLVVTPNLRILAMPIYSETPDGLLVSSVTSRINQPPTAPEVDVTISADYEKVESFQIPSRIVLDTKNLGRIEFTLSTCHVSTVD